MKNSQTNCLKKLCLSENKICTYVPQITPGYFHFTFHETFYLSTIDNLTEFKFF